ncbi:MAG TPA: hypothetical protein VJA47_05570, partial [archaeon]|nr:hypothetical protein [archaeon]
KPVAVVVAAGAINAVTGKRMEKAILERDQNYLVAPPQPWIDGWKDEGGTVYQFVAAELGSGETIEGQFTGEEKTGGIQIAVFNPKNPNLLAQPRQREHAFGAPSNVKGIYNEGYGSTLSAPVKASGYTRSRDHPFLVTLGGGATLGRRPEVRSMGLGRGGRIRQKIYTDPHGFEVWKESPEGSTCIYLVRSEDFRTITGEDPPHKPLTREDYERRGIPWFGLSDKDKGDAKGNLQFGVAKPVGAKDPEVEPKDVFQILDENSK